MELPGLLALVQNGLAVCVFWMALRFHYFFHAAKTQALLGLPTVPWMTKLTEQLHLHIFGQLAPVLPMCYLPAAHQPLPPANPFSPRMLDSARGGCNSTRIQNPTPNPDFHAFDKAGVPMTAKGQPMCLSYHLGVAKRHMY